MEMGNSYGSNPSLDQQEELNPETYGATVLRELIAQKREGDVERMLQLYRSATDAGLDQLADEVKAKLVRLESEAVPTVVNRLKPGDLPAVLENPALHRTLDAAVTKAATIEARLVALQQERQELEAILQKDVASTDDDEVSSPSGFVCTTADVG